MKVERTSEKTLDGINNQVNEYINEADLKRHKDMMSNLTIEEQKATVTQFQSLVLINEIARRQKLFEHKLEVIQQVLLEE